MAEMPFRIDPVVTDELLLEFVEQLDKLEHRHAELAIMENLYSGERSKDFYEGLLAGYANAFSVVLQSRTGGRTGKELGRVVAFVASKVWKLRPPSIHLRRHDRCIVVAGAQPLKLKPRSSRSMPCSPVAAGPTAPTAASWVGIPRVSRTSTWKSTDGSQTTADWNAWSGACGTSTTTRRACATGSKNASPT